MAKYANRKTWELWEGLKWNVIVTVLALIATTLAIVIDPFQLRETHPTLYAIVDISVFVLVVLIYIYGYYVYHDVNAKINRNKISLDLEFSTKPGRPPHWGRFLALIIHNNSVGEVEFSSVIPKGIKQESGKKRWVPPERLKSQDPLLWGSDMGNRTAETFTAKNKESVIVDILSTEIGDKAKLMHLQQRQSGSMVAIPLGIYLIELMVRFEHFGHQFEIPIKFKLTYEGGMKLKNIKPVGKYPSYVKRISLFYDNKIILEKENIA